MLRKRQISASWPKRRIPLCALPLLIMYFEGEVRAITRKRNRQIPFIMKVI